MSKSINYWLYFFLFLIIVVYASLIPFQVRPVAFSEALIRFKAIPYLNLGMQSRADWIANILLFIPLGFFLLAALDEKSLSSPRRGLLCSIVWIFCCLVAVFIECLQVYFPPRTVSLNDIYAEIVGSLIGIVVWVSCKRLGRRLWAAISSGGNYAINAILIIYCVIFISYSLFPFDFLLSFKEISWKVSNGSWGLFLSEINRQNSLRTVISLILEAFSVVPLGILFLRIRLHGKPELASAIINGAVLGAVLEILQFFLVSGNSQGVSVILKIIGFSGGVFYQELLQFIRDKIKSEMKNKIVFFLIFPYLITAFYLNGWFTHQWLVYEKALDKLSYAMAIPFYYHYFSSETGALQSIILHSLLYAPIGIAAYVLTNENKNRLIAQTIAIFFTIIISLIMEIGKLFILDMKPDFTNVIIAGGSVWITCKISSAIYRWLFYPSTT